MVTALKDEELAVLRILGIEYPAALHLHDVGQRMGAEMKRAELLKVVDGLFLRGLIEGKPLRGSEGLADAANLRITDSGGLAIAESSRIEPRRTMMKPAQAIVLNVLIASPSDVRAERDAVESAIHEWNASHFTQTGLMLRPVRWETNSFPASGGRAQGLINKQMVEDAHFLIGIFGSRLGTPTGVAESGTLEEIEQFIATGRHVALYFSDAPIARSADRSQLQALEAYQRKRQQDSLYATFGDVEALRRQVTAHLPGIVASVQQAMKNGAAEANRPTMANAQKEKRQKRKATARSMSIEEIGQLSPKEIELLWVASKDPNGELFHSETLDGEGLQSAGTQFLEGVDRRTAAEWISALRGLDDRGLIEARSEERNFFDVTGEGYAVADELQDFAQWETEAVTLRAYYMNAEHEELAIACTRVVALPATYYPDQVGADQSVMRSLKERRSLLVEGVVSKPGIRWDPTDVEFTESASGKPTQCRVDGMRYLRPGTLKLSISG